MATGSSRESPGSRVRSLRIAAAYAAFSFLWIYFSDHALELLVSDVSALARWSTFKGLAFVAVTSLLLFLLLRPAFAHDEERRVAEAALHESERRFLRTLDGILEGCQLIGHDWRYLYLNHAAAVQGRRPAEELLGKTMQECWPGFEQTALYAILRRSLTEQLAQHCESEFDFPDGGKGWFDLRVQPVPEGIFVLSIEVTERKHAARMEARLAAIVSSSEDAIISKSVDGTVTSWNPGASRLFGYTEEEMLGQNIRKLFPPENVEEEIGILARIAAGGNIEPFEAVRMRKDGTLIDVSVAISAIFDAGGKVVGGSKIARDITRRKEAELALRELNESLESKVAERTAELRAALVRAESADRIKSAFLATMSHELRTPLNSIIGFTGILRQGLAGSLNEEQERQLGMVNGSARHLLDVINDVLDLSKIEAGQLEVRSEAFDLPASLQRVVESVRPMADRKGLVVQVELSAGVGTMVSDRRRVEQILLNLLNNAIKFTDHGSVTLAAGLVGHEPVPAVRFRVIDTGIGIRPEDFDVLFQSFRQIDSGLSRMREGTGLGLAISQRLAALLGGTISVSSEWGKGSELTVILPRDRVS